MASDFRRSLKERAKERLGITFSRPKSKSVDEGACTNEEGEKENTSPTTQQHFTPLPWDAAVSTATSRMGRVEAPTHVDGDKSSRRLSGRLAQPKGTLEYDVSGSETLASIAAKFDTTTSELKKLNKLMTQMIWPGQKLFVPDKDYIPSTPTSPATSPVSTPREAKPLSFDIPLVRQTDCSRGPGLAKAVESPTEPKKEPPRRPLSEEDAQQLDKDCTERFIKVNVKHITDGQGVISGVLLVTPNAVMFDPNVSDPLVLEHGASRYGLIAPMETIRAVAMYHDIAAMKLKTSPQTSVDGVVVGRPVVYHAETCPLSQNPDLAPDETDDLDSDTEASDLIKDIPSGRTRQGSICSCGADSLLESSSFRSTTSSQEPPSFASTSPVKSFMQGRNLSSSKLAQLTIPEEGGEGFQLNTAISNNTNSTTTTHQGERGQPNTSADELLHMDNNTTASNLKLLGIETTVLSSLAKTVTKNGAREKTEDEVERPTGEESNVIVMSQNATVDSSSNRSSVVAKQEEEQQNTESQKSVINSGEFSHHLQNNSSTNNEYCYDTNNATNTSTIAPSSSCSSTITASAATITTVGMGVGTVTPLPTSSSTSTTTTTYPLLVPPKTSDTAIICVPPSTTPSRKPRTSSSSSSTDEPTGRGGGGHNILSRTLGSITSFGSFPHSPNFSTLVDFSTGLFVRNQEDATSGSGGGGRRVKDISEVDMATPPRPAFVVGSKGPDWSVDIGDDLDVKDGQAESIPIPGADPKPHVTNAMSLSEKPELFRDLDELIPKPAVHYEDPPLYLCLRLGRLQKPQTTTCPIEAYNKKKPKPEYWFSIPKDKVDPLYAFFIQWTPELYGEEDEVIDPDSRGFVVIEDEDVPEELEVIDDYFDKKKRGRRISLSKGWEVVSSDEVKRRMMEEFPVIIPELLTPSAILQEDHTLKISEVLPPRAEGYSWNLTYCSAKDGFSLKTLYRTNQKIDSPCLLVVLDTTGQVFGAMLSCGPKLSDHFYGSGETYLFTFTPEFKHFKWTGNNNFFIKGNPESLAIGSGEGSFGLWLDGDLYHGRTQKCETFNNDILSTTEDFVVKAVETWIFV